MNISDRINALSELVDWCAQNDMCECIKPIVEAMTRMLTTPICRCVTCSTCTEDQNCPVHLGDCAL